MTLTFGDLCAGGGGASLGLTAAGLAPAWAVEHDPDIAATYRANLGDHLIVADVLDLDPRDRAPVDLLWCSFPCQGASVARSKRLAPHPDADLGEQTLVGAPSSFPKHRTWTPGVGWLETLLPRFFVMENVPPYRHTPACKAIIAELSRLGYMTDVRVINAADYGVPQTRRRLIVRAILGGLVPPLPAPVPWVGWYAAIEDRISTLPESAFAPWQLARLPRELAGSVLMRSGNTRQEWGKGFHHAHEPGMTVSANIDRDSRMPRAFIVHPTDQRTMPVREVDEPVWTLTVKGWPRAFICDGKLGDMSSRVTVPDGDAPMFTVSASVAKHALKAFLVGGGNINTTIIDSKPRFADTPAFTTTAASVRDRAWLSEGRVVAMTTRALARFQSVPDSYELPAHKALASRIIGNMVPPLLARRIAEGLLR